MTITNTDTNIKLPVFNEMTKEIYDAQTSLNADEFYFVDPQFAGNKPLISDSNGDIVEGTLGNGITVDNGTVNTWFYYGTCSTSASTQTKIVDCPNFVLREGVNLRVKFTNAQTYNGQAKLNVNGTGAINVCRYGTAASQRYCWYTGEVVDFVYDGTNFMLVDGMAATTSYYGITRLTNNASSTDTGTALVPSALNNALQNIVTGAAPYSTSGTYAVGDYCRYSASGATYLYKCNTPITYDGENTHAWNASEWDIVDDLFTQINNLATVAKTGSYNDLSDKPYIPAGAVVDQTFDATSQNAQSGVAIADAGFITDITSNDVTMALGYTPANVFIAEYGTTAFADISAAITAGKTIIIHKGNSYAFLNDIVQNGSGNPSIYRFADVSPRYSRFNFYSCIDDGYNTTSWGSETYYALDPDLAYISATGKKTTLSLICPSSTTQSITKPASTGTFTAPDYGWVTFVHRVANAGSLVALGSNGIWAEAPAPSSNYLLTVSLWVEKGADVSVIYQSTATTNPISTLTFIKAKGVA